MYYITLCYFCCANSKSPSLITRGGGDGLECIPLQEGSAKWVLECARGEGGVKIGRKTACVFKVCPLRVSKGCCPELGKGSSRKFPPSVINVDWRDHVIWRVWDEILKHKNLTKKCFSDPTCWQCRNVQVEHDVFVQLMRGTLDPSFRFQCVAI